MPDASTALVLHSSVLAVDPSALHARTAAAVDDIYEESESPNTLRSYATALRYLGRRGFNCAIDRAGGVAGPDAGGRAVHRRSCRATKW